MANVSPPTVETALDRGRRDAILLGFSVRALAQAAQELSKTSGLRTRYTGVDCFGDQDCRQLTDDFVLIPKWGHDARNLLEMLLSRLPQPNGAGSEAGAAPQVLLAGGTENWPELLAVLRPHFTLLGPTAEQLKPLRNREFWRQIAAEAQVGFPESHDLLPISPSDEKSWLCKPRQGAGGWAIYRGLEKSSANTWSCGKPHYWQREVRGRSLGAHCVIYPDFSLLLGVTVSYTHEEVPGPSEFAYRGSWGPVDLPEAQRAQILDLCEQVRRRVGLRGWLQLDFIQDPHEQLWLLELNPRWAAGMEIILLSGINPLAYHLDAFDCRVARPLIPPSVPSNHLRFSKKIIYAPHEMWFDPTKLEPTIPGLRLADIPAQAHQASAGQPLYTLIEHVDQGVSP